MPSNEFAAIPEPTATVDSLLGSVSALKQTVEALMGVRGTNDSTAVTEQRLTEAFSTFRPVFGTWTPALKAATMGNLSVVFTTQYGEYVRVGSLVLAAFNLVTSTFTHSSASGAMSISGLPFQARQSFPGILLYQGITKANYTTFSASAADGTTDLALQGSGSGQSLASVNAADMPSGGSVILRAVVPYLIDN